jgi:hypothetical protein
MNMPSVRTAPQVSAANGKLQLLSLYGDLQASVRARRAVGAIVRLAGPHWQITSEMWKFDSLQASRPIREMITRDSANADVIIVAASSLSQSEPALIPWLNSLEAGRNNHPVAGLLIGLLGDDEINAADLDRVVKPLMHFARVAGRDFIWHRMEPGVMEDTDWMADGVQTLLSRKLWFEVFGRAFRKLAERPHLARPLHPAGTAGADFGNLTQNRT